MQRCNGLPNTSLGSRSALRGETPFGCLLPWLARSSWHEPSPTRRYQRKFLWKHEEGSNLKLGFPAVIPQRRRSKARKRVCREVNEMEHFSRKAMRILVVGAGATGGY